MNHGKGKKLYQGAADIHKVDASELPAVTAVSREVIGDLQKLEAERRAFLDNGNSKNAPDPKTLRDFQFRRNAIILSGALKLKRTLTPGSWAGLDGYINDHHRTRIRQISPPTQ